MANTNKKAPAPTKTQDALETNTNDLDFPTGKRPRLLEEQNYLIRSLVERGHIVHLGKHNDFTVCKYGYSHHCPDIVELRSFAVRLGVFHG